MTYKGDKLIIKINIAMLITDMALIMASLNMARISQLLSILRFIISASMLGAGVYGYKMVTSDDFKQKMIQEVISNIKMPEMPEMPKTTGGVSPFKI